MSTPLAAEFDAGRTGPSAAEVTSLLRDKVDVDATAKAVAEAATVTEKAKRKSTGDTAAWGA